MDVKSYYEMLRTIPIEERERLGLGDEYLKTAEETENIMWAQYRQMKEGK